MLYFHPLKEPGVHVMMMSKEGDVVPEELKSQAGDIARTADQIIDDMTLFDDDLMSMVFDGNIEAAELLLRIILDKEDIRVISVTGQKELKNPLVNGRTIKLDIFAQDSTGRNFDTEVQRSNAGAHFRRARFHSSMLDTRMLKKKQEFKDLLDSYVIFLTEHDVMGAGLPVYHIRRTIDETHGSFLDGSHIIYVNGSYQGNDPLGKLLHDFRCKHSSEMFYEELSDGMKHFKETEGGREIMCEAVEEYANEKARIAAEKAAEMAAAKNTESLAIKMLKAGKYALDEIASLTDLPLSQVQMLQKKI
jgi:hypothetical protein